ncbi:MAG: spore maturation protein [Clostridia bacterium]
MIIISIVIAFITGNIEVIISSIMSSCKSGVENVIGIVGMMCFWNGIFNVFEKTSAIKTFSNFFSKLIIKLFNKKELNEKALEYMSLNISSNIIGVGNASTINGIKAMEAMQELNVKKERPNNNMTTFVLINTASIQLIPTSMIALRTMYGSQNPTSIVIPIWIVTAISLIFGLVSIKILNKRMK